MNQGYTPIPTVLIEYIKENDYKILEMCGGNGYNAGLMKNSYIDIISYDIMTSENVKYGVAGTIEHLYSDRTLLLCSAMDAKLSVTNYLSGGGNRVILGGYLTPICVNLNEEIYVIDSMASSDITSIKIYNYTASLQSKANCYSIDIRPNPEWMRGNKWKLVKTYYNISSEKDPSVPLRIFQVWECG